MKATIQFLPTNNRSDIFNKFLFVVPRVEQLWQHMTSNGVLLEKLDTAEIEAMKQLLSKLKYTNFTIAGNTVKIGIENDKSLLRLIEAVPNSPNHFEEIIWKRGLTIEKLTQNQADQLDNQLKALGIGSVTIVPDTQQPPAYKIIGQVLWSDNTSLADKGYIVHAFDKNTKGELSLLGKAQVEPNSIYQITYTWQSDGRNSPDLIIQLFNPQGVVIAENRKQVAKLEEKINLKVEKIQPRTFTLTGICKSQATGAVLSNLQVEAQFRANNVTLLTRSGVTDEQGVINIPFDESLFSKLPADQQVEVVFIVSQNGQSLNTSSTIKSLQSGDQKVEILVTMPESNCEVFVVSGKVQREDGLLLQDLRVYAAHKMKQGLVQLGEGITNAQGLYTIRYKSLPEVKATHLHVTVTNEDGKALQSSNIIRNARPLEIVDLVIPIAVKVVTEQRIEGIIMLEHGMPANKLKLRLYRRDFGDKITLLAETSTLAGGQYAFTYDAGGQILSLEVRAVDNSNREVPLSKPLNNLSHESRVVLNLVAPGNLQPLAAEYHRLVADLTPHVGQVTALAQAKEDEGRQDLTVLNRATGWDARLIALAAMTERLAAEVDVKLPQEPLYGLLRVGLPSDKLLLAQVEPDVAVQALTKARDAGIVELTDLQIEQFKQHFSNFANTVRLNIPAPGSNSTYTDLLKASGLSQDVQNKFVAIYLSHRGDAIQLWEKARNAGLDETQIGRLQLQGKLAFLAGNSEAMTARLLQKQISDPIQLVERDYHRAETWVTEVFEQAEIPIDRLTNLTDADEQKLEKLIPVAYVAEKVDDRLHAYTEDMARKIRLSYPTQVVGRLIESDEKYKLPTAHDSTVTLLKNAVIRGFRLGETPIAAFFRANPDITAGMANHDAQAAQQQLQTLQRVYQITPSDEAMPVLISLNITSAFDVMAYTEAQFITLFNATYSEIYNKSAPPGLAALVSRKAKQVSSVTYNLFAIVKKLESDSPVAGISAPVQVRESVKNELIKQFPTMESLFGSMDFCECEHCRSVLSPAAYLVDLLQSLEEWGNTSGRPDMPLPYDVLVERRPDIPHIPLTCENTHTALPYIDIVNEVLEYYVAHGKLAEDTAHDTGEATTAELLAEPQNVIREAYDMLREGRYPLNLPFDLWIETVRQFCNYFETPLHYVLEVFRSSDNLFAPEQLFDRSAIFMESLGFLPAEVAIFIDDDPLAKWYELYGFTSDEEARAEATDETGQRIDINSAKALSRRLGITYKEIVDIVQTGFVNPQLSTLSVLYKLGISVGDARLYIDHRAFYKQNKDLISKERDTLQPADQLRFDELANKVSDTAFTGWHIVNELDALEKRLEGLSEEFKILLDDLETAIQKIPFDRILVLADPNAGCDFDQTTLRYADAEDHKADPIIFLRINLFVRLWRKLGWSIEEMDRALQAFIPKSAPFDAAHLTQRPLHTALVYLAHFKALDENLKVDKQNRLMLLTFWSDIATTGKQPLYAQLFLTRSVLKSAPVFDHPLGQYLQYFDNAANEYKPFYWDFSQPENPATGNVSLRTNILTLQGALGLTADEIEHILIDAGKSLNTAALSLTNVSLLYHHGLLAKALKLAVRELIALKQLSGLDPFKALHPDPLATLEQDHPFSQTLEFAKVVEEVKESGLKIEDLDYLLRHRFDETGKYRPNHESTLALLKTLAESARTIRAEHAVPEDPDVLSEEVLRQKLGLILPSDTTERLLGMVNTTVEFTSTKSGVNEAGRLNPGMFVSEERIHEVSYKEIPYKEQKLTVRGVLFDPAIGTMRASFDTVLTGEQKSVFADLLDSVKKNARDFFDNHLKKQKLRLDGEAGFLEEDDFADVGGLFSPLTSLKEILTEDDIEVVKAKLEENAKIEKENQEMLQTRRHRIAQAFLPVLQRRLIRQFIVQTMTAQTGADATLVESLLTDGRLLLVNTGPLLDALAATAERGLTATFWTSADATGEALPVIVLAEANTGIRGGDGNPLKPAGANSARLEGYLEVPVPGAYRLTIQLDRQNAEAELRLSHLMEPVFLKGKAAVDFATLGENPNEFLELKAGTLYRFVLDLKHLNGSDARLLVQGEIMPKGPLSQLALYPANAFDAAERAAMLLNKALQVVQSLGLNEHEVRYLLINSADFDGVSLSELPTGIVGDTPADREAATKRFEQYRRLVAYARLKRDLANGTDDLIEVFEANAITSPDRLEKQVYPLIAKLTRRDEATIATTAEALFITPTFANEISLRRLWQALQVVDRFGVAPAALVKWTGIVQSSTLAAERFEIARDLKEAIKARFEPETWQRVAQPIFDRLRQRQRDALVSHVLQQLRTKPGTAHINTLEKLYEYFLIDPGMEPVVQTSRIRLAISSVQLFIQRCLLNLEPKVQPSTINSQHWEWMKRYRVWEANRKIFLFPENWLEPEFRDDKTHLFTELEGALLQGDVSSDLVEDAFLNYLKKLDELARLDIVAMHIEDNADPARRTLHVFGRTHNQPHQYFYRRYAHQMWTPWEPVTAEVTGDHLAPVIWRDRLYLFWVTFMDKPIENPLPIADADTRLTNLTLGNAVSSMLGMAANKNIEVQLHWSEYLQGEWSTYQSSQFFTVSFQLFLWFYGGYVDIIPSPFSSSFDLRRVFIHISKETYDNDGQERGLFVHLNGPENFQHSFYVAGRNSAPVQGSYQASPQNVFSASTPRATRYSGAGELKVSFHAKITNELSKRLSEENPDILQQGQSGGYTLLPCNNNLTALGFSDIDDIASLIKPVFYQDNQHTFFIEPSVTERTIEEWQEWVAHAPRFEPGLIMTEIEPVAVAPTLRLPNLKDLWTDLAIDKASLVTNTRRNQDWMTNSGTVLQFDKTLIGPAGQSGLQILIEQTTGAITAGTQVNINPGSGLASGKVVMADAQTFEQSGLIQMTGGMNVVGGAGFNSALEKNLSESIQTGLGASMSTFRNNKH
ncbi:neuraminidase-like domain-containing protein [Nitrosomonas sp. Nm166]|uniref:neuraminidase-like domain-containing protein n=1 Tax=Nitrosomonas sp. Nm166 TaxID=1881054 RepID=UPI0008E7ACDD|nr:neuraminidase-like domain-containing protein [Nitrosomonas sp. Nm166]SFE35463.1 virulence plasmid A protein [Nitrosomonas sp. Nm166]